MSIWDSGEVGEWAEGKRKEGGGGLGAAGRGGI